MNIWDWGNDRQMMYESIAILFKMANDKKYTQKRKKKKKLGKIKTSKFDVMGVRRLTI